MARKKSLWSELQRERERRQRVAQARERMNEQTVKQLMRDHDRREAGGPSGCSGAQAPGTTRARGRRVRSEDHEGTA
jgi:hypothetical protein